MLTISRKRRNSMAMGEEWREDLTLSKCGLGGGGGGGGGEVSSRGGPPGEEEGRERWSSIFSPVVRKSEKLPTGVVATYSLVDLSVRGLRHLMRQLAVLRKPKGGRGGT